MVVYLFKLVQTRRFDAKEAVLREGKIGLRDLATMLDLSMSESIDLLLAMGISGNIRTGDLIDSLRSLDASSVAE